MSNETLGHEDEMFLNAVFVDEPLFVDEPVHVDDTVKTKSARHHPPAQLDEQAPRLLHKISKHDVQGHLWQIIFALAVLPFCPNLAAIGRCASSCHLMQDIVHDIEEKDLLLQRWKELLTQWKAGHHGHALNGLIPIMIQCSPGAKEPLIRGNIHFGNDGLLSSWDMSHCNLSALPDEIGILCFAGWLRLDHNLLKSLPESFGNIRVLCLNLDHNQLQFLPESFGNIRMSGALYLSDNELEYLPASFCEIRVRGSIWLHNNLLESLPENFSCIELKNSLNLSGNQLKSLSESFGAITVGGNLDLSNNQLKSLPESFGNITVESSLYLTGNPLKSLPKSFDKITVGKKIYIDKRLSTKGLDLKGRVKRVKP